MLIGFFKIQKNFFRHIGLTLISTLVYVCCLSFVLSSTVVEAGTPQPTNGGLTASNINATTPAGCKEKIAPREVKIWDMIPPKGPNIANYLPIIPEACGLNADKTAIQPLGIKVIPDIIIRLVGLLFTLAFTILPLAIIVLGFNLALKPFDSGINKTEFTEITTLPRLISKQLGSFVIGMALILFSYTIVFTVLNLLGFQGEYTSLDKFFTP